MQLYKINDDDVIKAVTNYSKEKSGQGGRQEIIDKDLSDKYRYPLKVIFSRENDRIIVLTAYPLRKERKS